jgi:hypothetical protein
MESVLVSRRSWLNSHLSRSGDWKACILGLWGGFGAVEAFHLTTMVIKGLPNFL